MTNAIYLDYNATAPLRLNALSAMQDVLGLPLNASSVHNYGRQARGIVESAREKIAALVNAPPAQIIFNSGATEGNNTVLQYFAFAYSSERILVSAIEHSSILESVPKTERIPVTPEGLLDLDALEEMLKDGEKTSLVSVMLVNNETGIIQPVAEAAALAHRYGALFHCDAVQAAGRIPISMEELGCDFLTLSSHKIGGPQGVGALVLGLCGITPSLLSGGGQEKQARAGTENIAGIAGFGAAAELASRMPDTHAFQTQLETGLKKISPDIKIYGEKVRRIPNTTMFAILGMRSESLLMNFDLEGIALSNGSACSSGSVQPSHVLTAMGASDEEAGSVLRVSTGWNTNTKDIDMFLEVWKKIYARIRKD